LGRIQVTVHFLEKKRANKSAMKPCPIYTEYTIFDALLETLQKKEKKNSGYLSLFKHFCSPMNLAALLLMAIGLVTIVWVGNLFWCDITFWGKDISLILFGSRTGEDISLGIGMKAIHYLLMGAALLFSGSFMLIRSRRIRVMK